MKDNKIHPEEIDTVNDRYSNLTAEEWDVLESGWLLNNERMEEEYKNVLDLKASYKGDKFLSEVFDIDREVERYGNKIFLIAGVGAGKSSWVKNVLANKKGAEGNTLFITSRRAKVDEDTEQSLFNNRLSVDDPGSFCRTLVTNSKLAYFLMETCLKEENKNNTLVDKFLDIYKYIVIDEVHSLATDSIFAESSFHVLSFMEYAVERGKTVIAMTGTPQPIYQYFSKNNWHICDFRKQCRYVKPLKMESIIDENVIKRIKNELKEDRKVIYFVNHVRQIKDLCKTLALENPKTQKSIIKPEELAVIVSKNKNEELKEQLNEVLGKNVQEIIDSSVVAYDNIIKKQLLPDKCKILISTSTLREGIDIFNKNVTAICDNHILSNIIQFCGRTRLGDSVFYIVRDKPQHRVENSELLYSYACNNELDAANDFYLNNIEEKRPVSQLTEFIQHVERNGYIRFNYIKKIFMIDYMRYKEELRIQSCLNTWEEELKEYCDEYNIFNFYMTSSQKKEWLMYGLNNLVSNEKKLFEEEQREALCKYLYIMLGLERMYKQPKKINLELEKYGYKIVSNKESGGEHRNKTFWCIKKCFPKNYK